jgi:phytoene synthase
MLFYRFCRTIDDIADNPKCGTDERADLLGQWIHATENGLSTDLEELIRKYDIERSLLTEIVRGCISDIAPQRFATIHDLEAYCWKVACAVGLVSIKIFGCVDPKSKEMAIHLGHALQLTNILRDVGEDARQGRIYLPLEDLVRFGVREEEILNFKCNHNFAALMRFEAARARRRFAAVKVPDADFHALLPARIMQAVYEQILNRLEKRNFPVFDTRIGLGKPGKIACALTAWLQPRADRTPLSA